MMSLKLTNLGQMRTYTTMARAASRVEHFPESEPFDKLQAGQLSDLPEGLDPFEHSIIWVQGFGIEPVNKVAVDDHAV